MLETTLKYLSHKAETTSIRLARYLSYSAKYLLMLFVSSYTRVVLPRLAQQIGSSLALVWFRKRAARAANNSHVCPIVNRLPISRIVNISMNLILRFLSGEG